MKNTSGGEETKNRLRRRDLQKDMLSGCKKESERQDKTKSAWKRMMGSYRALTSKDNTFFLSLYPSIEET